MTKPTDDELRNRFLYHPPPDQARVDDHALVSTWCLELAMRLRNQCPEGRNLALALTHLEDVRMRANSALACDSPDSVPGEERRMGSPEGHPEPPAEEPPVAPDGL